MKLLKSFSLWLYDRADQLNRRNILELVGESRPPEGNTRLLDLGCDDGSWTRELGHRCGANELHGVEIVPSAATQAANRGIVVHQLDLNEEIDLPEESFDLIHANQVIEHVTNVDTFVSQIFRLLRPGGYAVVSTENGSSWHNIGAAILGWQVFSSTNISGKIAGLGNPLAIHRKGQAFSATWTHKTILNYLGLIELFEVHGFETLKVTGAGYYPLPATLGRIDVRHCHFITLHARKPPRDSSRSGAVGA